MKRFSAGLFAVLISFLLVVPAFALPQDEDDFEWKPLVSLSAWDYPAATFVWSLPSLATYKAAGNECVLFPYIVMTGNTLTHIGYIDPSGLGTNHVWENGISFAIASDPSNLDSSLPSTIKYGVGRVNTSSGAFNFNPDIPRFSSDKEALQYFVDNDPTVVLGDSSFQIPIGYAAWFKARGTLTLRCTFPSNSNLVPSGRGWWGETRQTLGSADSLPSDSFQPSGVQIVWARDSALSALGVLGTTKHAYSEHAAMSPWTVIVNPVNKYLALGSDQNTRDSYNGPITVSGIIGEFRLYPLAGSWSPSSGLEDDGSGSDYIDVNIDPETGEPIYTDPDGNVVTPPAPGGSTALPEAVSSTSLVQRIVGILSDLVNRIEGIFSVAYQAISNLVGLAGPFVAKLSALYSWLPAPVLSALSSAMILAITIGVLKVFL